MTLNTPNSAAVGLLDIAKLRHIARHLVRDAADADDLVQDALMASLQRGGYFNGSSDGSSDREVSGWSWKVLRNLARNRARGRAARAHREAGHARPEHVSDALDGAAAAERGRDISRAVLGLKEPYRTVILMRFFEDAQPREIAKRTGRNVDTVQRQLTRGKAELKRQLERQYGDRGNWAVALLPLTGPNVLKSSAVVLGWGGFVRGGILLLALAAAGVGTHVWLGRSTPTPALSHPELAAAAPSIESMPADAEDPTPAVSRTSIDAQGGSAAQDQTQTLPVRPVPVTCDEGASKVQPSGSLHVRVEDEAGQLIPGVAIKLLPPNEESSLWEGEWVGFQVVKSPLRQRVSEVFREGFSISEWTQVTDENGLAVWSGFPASAGYQWGIPDSKVIQYQPEQVVQSARMPDGSLKFTGPQPSRWLSGAFTIKAGAVTALNAKVATETSIRGSFALARPEEATRVAIKLFHLDSPSMTAAQGYRRLSIERSLSADADGRFLITPVMPGQKVLRAWWRSEGGYIYFADRRFEVLAGEKHDVGELYARVGRSVKVSAKLVNSRGQHVQSEGELKTIGGPVLNLRLMGADGLSDVDQSVEFGFDEVLTLHGLPQGDLHAALDWSLDFAGMKDENALLRLPKGVAMIAESEDELTLEVGFIKTVQRRVEARFPKDVAACRAEVHLVSQDDGRSYSQDLKVNRRVPGKAAGGLRIPAGRYLCYVHTHTPKEPNAETSYHYVGYVEIAAAEAPIVVDLEPSATLDGQAVGPDALPQANDSLFIVWEPFQDAAVETMWTHMVKTDATGHFSIRGLIPQARFVTSAGIQFKSGLPGTRTEARWKW